MQTRNIEKIQKAVLQYPEAANNFDAKTWIENERNIALINEQEDVALFERYDQQQNAVFGHYFFFSRGKEAIETANQFLKEIFTTPEYSVKIILGFTPVEHKAALWMNKRLGFETLGIVNIDNEDYQLVMLTKPMWEQGRKNHE